MPRDPSFSDIPAVALHPDICRRCNEDVGEDYITAGGICYDCADDDDTAEDFWD